MNRYVLNETSYFGAGCRTELATEVKNKGYKKALLVSDKILASCGVLDKVKDVLNKDTYLNTKNGIIEYEDGKTIEFTHKNSEMNGPAVETFPNGDKIEFNFVNDKRIGEAEKFYKNGDRELFIYGENNQKNGNSVYYFANGDVEETTYVNGILQGPAKYIYKDGVVEQYKYKDGKRIEN